MNPEVVLVGVIPAATCVALEIFPIDNPCPLRFVAAIFPDTVVALLIVTSSFAIFIPLYLSPMLSNDTVGACTSNLPFFNTTV